MTGRLKPGMPFKVAVSMVARSVWVSVLTANECVLAVTDDFSVNSRREVKTNANGGACRVGTMGWRQIKVIIA